ncbi:amidase-related protein [Oceanicola granulosus HTCC2516]|uniref:Amidase-related protein n=1 Tax=Oceanicola granulosus (strain ATCC BAA-861 / DSM 15982 / KCTC 12143 / HTCC2516) TaxID=314256 RepID=Q2CH85_OCEGH|nr:acetamidase/formamidase family protein [Oceanicola granulosus]EAR51926.1 amidase-related protein [Oceanicola granulosus HTCC2516]
MAHHILHATPETVLWGRFGAAIPPVLTIAPGDTVEIETLSGLAELFPPEGSGMTVSPSLRAINDAGLPFRWGHLLTGPIAIDGARPGDVLEVAIEEIAPGADWGFTAVEPFDGTLPEDFVMPERELTHFPIDRDAGVARPPWGGTLPLRPFFGVMGVAPPPEYGEISSREPRKHGGNLDNRRLVAGTRVQFPVWADGALFTCGDGHGLQGDGEVCVTALETALTGRLRFELHPAGTLPPRDLPRAFGADSLISMGFGPDLDAALKIALREMIVMIRDLTDLPALQAYQLCSLTADFAVTQSVNGEKGIHGVLPRSALDGVAQ